MSPATESFTWTTPCEFYGHFTVNIVPGHVRIYAGQEVEPANILVDMAPPSAPAPLSREVAERDSLTPDTAYTVRQIYPDGSVGAGHVVTTAHATLDRARVLGVLVEQWRNTDTGSSEEYRVNQIVYALGLTAAFTAGTETKT